MKNILPLLSILLVENVYSANVLYVSSTPFPSYYKWNQVLAFALVGRGHNVTFLTGYQTDLVQKPNYTEILIEGVYEVFRNNSKLVIHWETMSPLRFIRNFSNFRLLMCRTSTKSPGLSYLLNSYRGFKFDLIIFDLTLGTCFYPFIRTFKYPPAVGVTQYPLPAFTAFGFGNPMHPSYIPWQVAMFENEMTFFDRIWNSFLTYFHVGGTYVTLFKLEHRVAQTIFGNDIPSMEDLERKISLAFVNIDQILNHPQPLAPNVIPVSGVHLTESKKLPQDLQKILDEAKHGAIVFSLGTLVIWNQLPQEIQKHFIEAFGDIKETVLWKFDGEMEDVPKNVILRKWLPQNDVLGHSNVKLFIGHCGALSTQEALYHGVPVVCIPFYRDQFYTSKMVVKRKFGVSLSLHEIESKRVLSKLQEVLRNPIYSRNVKRAVRLYKNRKETPIERFTFWVEYLLEFGDVDFLNTAARDLPFYKSSGLDVIMFLVSLVLVLILVLYKVGRFILMKLTPKIKVKSS